jgi:predicted negative regulator of RcsB-dependent stress response
MAALSAAEAIVDENLTDEERVEVLREWWKENGWFFVGGIVVFALAWFGWNQYQAYNARQNNEASTLYQSLKKAADANDAANLDKVLAELRDAHASSPYAAQGGLLVASEQLVSAPERAAESLRYVMDHTKDAELAMIARLRLARVLAYREQYDDALKVLDVKDPGQFSGRLNEIKGDVAFAQGKVDDARAAYLAALVADGSELLDRNLLQMKLNDLPPRSSEAPAAPAAAPGDGAAAPAKPGEGA